MSNHPKEIKKYEGSLDELAKDIGNLQYDIEASLLERLADDIKRQADADLAKGRTQLAEQLYKTAEELYKARDRMYNAWKICEPYMNENKEK
jgi:propanediol dehydratase small subunit